MWICFEAPQVHSKRYDQTAKNEVHHNPRKPACTGNPTSNTSFKDHEVTCLSDPFRSVNGAWRQRAHMVSYPTACIKMFASQPKLSHSVRSLWTIRASSCFVRLKIVDDLFKAIKQPYRPHTDQCKTPPPRECVFDTGINCFEIIRARYVGWAQRLFHRFLLLLHGLRHRAALQPAVHDKLMPIGCLRIPRTRQKNATVKRQQRATLDAQIKTRYQTRAHCNIRHKRS